MQRGMMGAGIAVGLTLAQPACASQEGTPQGPSTAVETAPAPTGSASPMDLEQFTPAPTGAVDEDTGETLVPQPVPTWDERSRASAVQAAQTAMAAFARPSLDDETWWAELSPLLTQQAQHDYAYVDPANVPATAVTGPGVLVDESSAYVANVEVPTDVGVYTLVLTRADAGAPWLTSRFTPPKGVR